MTKRDAKGQGEEGEKEEAGAFEVKAAASSFRFQCCSCFVQDGTNGPVDTVTSKNPPSLTAEHQEVWSNPISPSSTGDIFHPEGIIDSAPLQHWPHAFGSLSLEQDWSIDFMW